MRVLDESDRPVGGVPIDLGGAGRWLTEELEIPRRTTNEDGVATYRLPFVRWFHASIQLPGHHPVAGGRTRPGGADFLRPWSAELVLRAVPRVDPQPQMRVGMFSDFAPPPGEPWAFDLLRTDWLPPYGNGRVADVMITCTQTVAPEPSGRRVRVALRLEFPGLLDGAIPCDRGRGDISLGPRLEVVHPRHAPQEGYLRVVDAQVEQVLPVEPNPHTRLQIAADVATHYIVRIRSGTDPARAADVGLHGVLHDVPWLTVFPDAVAGDGAERAPPHLVLRYVLNPRPGRVLETDVERRAEFGIPTSEVYAQPSGPWIPRRERATWPHQQRTWWEEIYEMTGVWVGDGPVPERVRVRQAAPRSASSPTPAPSGPTGHDAINPG